MMGVVVVLRSHRRSISWEGILLRQLRTRQSIHPLPNFSHPGNLDSFTHRNLFAILNPKALFDHQITIDGAHYLLRAVFEALPITSRPISPHSGLSPVMPKS